MNNQVAIESNSSESNSDKNAQPVTANSNGKAPSKKHGYLDKIVVILITILIISIVTFLLFNLASSFFESTNNANIAAAQAALRAENKMVFVEQEYKRVFFIENTTQFGPISRTDNHLLLSVNYILRAGIDLSDLELREEGNLLVVSYKMPEIIDIAVDYGSLDLMFGQRYRTVFNSNPVRFSHFLPAINGGVTGITSAVENNRVVREEIVGIRDIAMQGGLEWTVRNNAEWWFSNYLNILGFNNIFFETRK